MNKVNTIWVLCLLLVLNSGVAAQTTGMQFSGVDCNNNTVDLFADLDAGKAVVLFYYMPNCGSCPPPAQKIQAMANNINAKFPGKVKGYAFPYQNVTTCSYSASWVSSNSLSTIYTAMDSGASQVSYYGGFGMPTVVLLGGLDHKVLFSTLSFSTSDTTVMRDEILTLLGSSGLRSSLADFSSFRIYPNPATSQISVDVELQGASDLLIDITDVSGQRVALIANERQSGLINKQVNIESLPTGLYFIRLQVNGESVTKKINIIH